MKDLGGTQRECTTSETLQKIKPYLKQAGITRLANLTGLDCLNIPVYTCYRPQSKHLSSAQGKGINDELAICSAYMEAIEHYYAENPIAAEYKKSYKNLDPTTHINPKTFNSGTYSISDLNSYELAWIPAKNINNDIIYIPRELINFDLTTPNLSWGLFKTNTTGLASGNSPCEAQCHGLLEIIERHGLYNLQNMNTDEIAARAVCLKTIDCDYANDLLEKIQSNKLKITLLDLSNEFHIPIFYCVLSDANPFRQLPNFSGSGAHLSPDIALCRALTEAAQARLTYISGTRDDVFPKEYRHHKTEINIDGKRNYARTTKTDMPATMPELLNVITKKFVVQGYHDILTVTHLAADLSVTHTIVPGVKL